MSGQEISIHQMKKTDIKEILYEKLEIYSIWEEGKIYKDYNAHVGNLVWE